MKNKYLLFLFAMLLLASPVLAQEEEAAVAEKPELNLQLAFHTLENKLPYLMISTKIRKDNSFQVVPRTKINVYFKEEIEENLIGSPLTDDKGVAKLVLPPSMKAGWDSSLTYPFIAVAAETKDYTETRTEIEITRARIELDTTLTDEGNRAVSVKILQFDGTDWVPAPEVEVKIGVKRSAGLLPISEEETYTTDSAGTIVAEFLRDSLPTDQKNGNIELAVRMDENETFGNALVVKTVPWGVYTKHESNFGKRSLWATADKAPWWLLFMAISIIAGVWGVIFYLVYVIIRLRKLGKEENYSVAEKQPVAVAAS